MRQHLLSGGKRLADLITRNTGIETMADIAPAATPEGRRAGALCLVLRTRQGNGWPVLLEVDEFMAMRVIDLCNERTVASAPPSPDGIFSARTAFSRLRPLLEAFSLVPTRRG